MSDTSTGKIVIEAPHSKVENILFEISQYPTWSSAIKSVSILEKDEKGRALSATLAIDAGMMKDRVTLEYDWSRAPQQLSFSMTDADLLTQMDGAYIITAQDEGTTEVTYELLVDLSMPIPAMMRHKAEQATINMALEQLKTFAEQ
jgi:ribosome-associated toxin RatA of RatAB toxin-antitoxin module